MSHSPQLLGEFVVDGDAIRQIDTCGTWLAEHGRRIKANADRLRAEELRVWNAWPNRVRRFEHRMTWELRRLVSRTRFAIARPLYWLADTIAGQR
jgi:hypothetical protein